MCAALYWLAVQRLCRRLSRVQSVMFQLLQTFLKASEVFRKAGDLQRALHAYNGMRKKGVWLCCTC